jgi:CBS domain-containing protein
MSVRDVLVLMKQHNTGCVLVCEQEKLVGIFSQRDVLRLLALEADLGVLLETVMTRNPVTLKEGDTVATAIARMTAGGYRHLPIVDGEGRPTGLLKVRGIVHYLVEHVPKTIYNLPPDPKMVAQTREGA